MKAQTVKTACLLLIPGLLLSLLLPAQPIEQQQSFTQSNLSYVDPTIGNVAPLLQPTRPTVQLPNQMMRMHPLRTDYSDDQISGFPLIVLSHRLGDAFCIKPLCEEPKPESWEKRLTYDHDLEVTRPWYYETYLVDYDVIVSFVPGKKAGIFRFVFPSNGKAKVLLFNSTNNGLSRFQFPSASELTGMETYHDHIKVYLYGRFNNPGSTGIVKDNAVVPAQGIESTNSRSFIRFSATTADTIEFRYAISYISAEQARKNYEEEVHNASPDQLQKAGEAAWEKVLGSIQVQGGTLAQKRSFYTALYRCMERMVDITEDGQYYSGFDNKVHPANRSFYVDDWAWDTYLAHHPLRTILNPVQEEDILNSYVNMYSQGGWLPTFPVLFGDHACMNGFHSSIILLDGYRKGLRRFDVERAFEGMYRNSTQATMLPWRNGPKTDLDEVYYSKGYFPALKLGETETNPAVHPFERRQAVAVTLGASYDDWAVGQMAKELRRTTEYQLMKQRAGNYKNLWHGKSEMFLPRDAEGNWILIDPKFDGGKGGRDYYDENNGWTYLWQVQQDLPGLINLLGGKQGFENKLDQLFREPLGRNKNEWWAKFPDATGMVGQYSMGNEPGFHIPYLYNLTGSPWKTQKRMRFLLDIWFKDNLFGIPGDEDGGGMSAFVVFSSLGFYPLTPGRPLYTIGSPVFERSVIHLPDGKQFTIIAEGCSVVNKYIQRATFDGKELNTPWFTHQQLVNGGTLHLVMGPKPNKQWGTGMFTGLAE